MKEIKTFLIVDAVILLLKVLGGLLLHSYTILVSGVYDALLIIGMLLLRKKVEERKMLKGIFTALLGALSIMFVLSALFFAFTTEINRTSLLLLIPIFVCLISRYIVSCFYTNVSYQRKKGLLSLGTIGSSYDFAIYIIAIVVMVLMKISKWVGFLKYSDRIGAVIIGLFVVYKAYDLIRHSFAYLKGMEKEVPENYIDEIKNRREVKSLEKIEFNSYGGFSNASCYIQVNDGVSMVDVNSFVITLQDYLLKIADMVKIYIVEKKKDEKPKKAKVRSKKQDARNSRSGNSKKSSKGKNSKQKNKKR